MRLRAKVVKGIGYGWLTLVGNGILLGLAWIKPSFSELEDLLDPFDLLNLGAVMLVLAPGLGALMWAEKLETKTRS